MKRSYYLCGHEDAARVLELVGREAWAMHKLLAAADVGCSIIDQPAPRWSHYVWKLRGRGVAIETLTERHGGDFPGRHARYVLRSKVLPVRPGSGGRNDA